jgi:hypothetical protein
LIAGHVTDAKQARESSEALLLKFCGWRKIKVLSKDPRTDEQKQKYNRTGPGSPYTGEIRRWRRRVQRNFDAKPGRDAAETSVYLDESQSGDRRVLGAAYIEKGETTQLETEGKSTFVSALTYRQFKVH